jgi:dTDP-4-dehydrorhamnose 3,5-epimerase-like enzyme
MRLMPLDDVRWLDLPTITGEGMVTFAQQGQPLPFVPQRIYYLHGVPEQSVRGAHAHKELQQAIFAVSGAFTLMLDDGVNKREFVMNEPTKALYIPKMLWRELHSFTPGAVCMVLASLPYDEDDYIRNYDAFMEAAGKQGE